MLVKPGYLEDAPLLLVHQFFSSGSTMNKTNKLCSSSKMNLTEGPSVPEAVQQ